MFFNQLASAGRYGDGFHAAAIVHVILFAGCAALTVALPQRVPPGAGQPTVCPRESSDATGR